MSLFNGKKAPQDEKGREKHGLSLFVDIYLRKPHRLAALNIMYFILTLPLLFYVYLTFNGYMAALNGGHLSDMLPGVGFYAAIMSAWPRELFISLLALSALIYGPVKMGQTYMLSNFTRGKHVWMTDFFTKAVSNWKQGLFFGFLDFAVTVLMLGYIASGWRSDYPVLDAALALGRGFCWAALALYFTMRPYFYLMSVSAGLTIFSIIKNAWILTAAKPKSAALATFLVAAVWFAALFTVPLITAVSLPLFIYSLTGLISAFLYTPVVDKYVIKR